MMNDIIFETERLYYRVPTIHDAKAMQTAKEANWAELQKWMNWATNDQLSMDATLNFITNFVQDDLKKGGRILFAFHKQTDDLVMIGGFNATDEKDTYSTGYWGSVHYLGQGYATEKTKGVIDYVFQNHCAKKLVISYYEGNEASKRIIDKCRFKFAETKPKFHKCCLDGTMMDEHFYEMTFDDWQKRI